MYMPNFVYFQREMVHLYPPKTMHSVTKVLIFTQQIDDSSLYLHDLTLYFNISIGSLFVIK